MDTISGVVMSDSAVQVISGLYAVAGALLTIAWNSLQRRLGSVESKTDDSIQRLSRIEGKLLE